MKIVFRAAVCGLLATLVLSAPVGENVPQGPEILDMENVQADYQREKRLNEGYYAAPPCAAVSPSNTQLAAFLQGTPHQSNIGPAHQMQRDAAYWYRTEDAYKDDREIMRYTDAEFDDQTPTGNILRSAPPPYVTMNTAHSAALNDQMMHPVKTTYGVFQNANIDGCGVPLLFSCTPSIVTGRIINPEASFGYDNPVQMMGKPIDTYSGLGSHYLHGTHAIFGEQTPKDHSSTSGLINSNNVHNKMP